MAMKLKDDGEPDVLKEPDRSGEMITRAEAQELAREAAQSAVQFLLNDAAKSSGPGFNEDAMGRLALAIAGLTAQNSGKKYIDPEVLAQRAQANARMVDLIARYKAMDVLPSYKLTGITVLNEVPLIPTYIDAKHVQRPVEIGWPEAPNMSMVPMDEPAKEIFAAFLASIGEALPSATPQPVISPRGVVVRKGTVAHMMPDQAPPAATPDFGGLQVRTDNNPTRLGDVRVLGSLAEPAKQMSR